MTGLYERVSQEIDDDVAIIEANTLLNSGDKAFKIIAKIAGGSLLLIVFVFWIPTLLNLKNVLGSSGPIPWLYHALLVDMEKWGQFGDFLGGLLNPIVGLATIYLILINVRLQKRELSLALREMKNSNKALEAQNAAIEIQNFQNTFFNWVSSYREVLNDANFQTRGRDIFGASALRALYKGEFANVEIESSFGERGIDSFFSSFSGYELMQDEAINNIIEDILCDKWSQFKTDYHSAASSVKSLIGLIDWILNKSPTRKTQHEYLEILADQLSYIEIAFILYEVSLTRGLRLKKLNEHKFFDKLKVLDDPSMYFMRTRARY
jgi:hypothetical protein